MTAKKRTGDSQDPAADEGQRVTDDPAGSPAEANDATDPATTDPATTDGGATDEGATDEAPTDEAPTDEAATVDEAEPVAAEEPAEPAAAEEQAPVVAEPTAAEEKAAEPAAAVEVTEPAAEKAATVKAGPRKPMPDKPVQTVGRRKQAVVRVRLKAGAGAFQVNGKDLETYFPNKVHQQLIREPLVILDTLNAYDVIASLHGGGISGQAGALRLGIARALIELDSDDRPLLKKAGFLTRDPRVKERKKYGLKKARKAPQYSKR